MDSRLERYGGGVLSPVLLYSLRYPPVYLPLQTSSFSMVVSSCLKLVKYLLSAHTKAWYVLKGGSEPFLELEPGGPGSELYPVTSSMKLCSRHTACPYAAMFSSTERRQSCGGATRSSASYKRRSTTKPVRALHLRWSGESPPRHS